MLRPQPRPAKRPTFAASRALTGSQPALGKESQIRKPQWMFTTPMLCAGAAVTHAASPIHGCHCSGASVPSLEPRLALPGIGRDEQA
ncbi:hypothetical protein AAFF_G00304430 [Aldrovandia affinis]|uniref:Uncharacterized protein n=1 Tax=Aldrovandia affinis TaxID=143900 RepID=A0AAD7WR57_9TELE|nr:hypothetical protein AAFF_G00304430 [Aldrovandia affinis]